MDKKVIVDFDETLVKVNSFTKWVMFLWLYSMKKFDLKIFFSVSKFIFYRKIVKKYTHQEFKMSLIKLNFKEDYYINFSKELSKTVNQKVADLVQELLNNGYEIAISSAAPEKYLKYFIEYYFPTKDFLIIGSTIENDLLNENFGINKINNLIRVGFFKKNEEYEILFTDSHHDLPAAELAKKIYLVNPQDKSRYLFNKEYQSKLEVLE